MVNKEMSNVKVMMRMITLVTPLFGWMCLAIITGVAGFFCAIFIPVSGALVVVQGLGVVSWIPNSTILIFMVVIAVLRGILHYIEQACNHYIAFKLLAILRDKIFAKLRVLAPAKLEGHEKGNLITIITSDIELLEVFYAHTISPICIAILTSMILLVLFWKLHVLFFVIALIAYLYVGLRIPLWISKKGKQIGNSYRSGMGEISSYTLESIRGLDDILQYDQGEKRLAEMQKQADTLHKKQAILRQYEGKSSAKSSMAIQGFSILILFCGLGFAQHGAISFGMVVLATILMFSSFGPVIALANLSNNLLVTLASGRRVLALLEEEPQVLDIQGKETASFGDISFENVQFAYEKESILEDVSASFQKGKITGILGKSGSGKSTMLKLMMRFWNPQKGSISMHQRDLSTINSSDLRAMQSLVTQDTVLFHDSIANNIKIAKRDATMEEVQAACRQASIHEFIMSLPNGYESNVAELGDSLSGGEKQRIALARAFLHDSDCILLDEPTSNLDALNESVILTSLQNMKDKTIILVTHRASTMNICDSVLHMKEGRFS